MQIIADENCGVQAAELIHTCPYKRGFSGTFRQPRGHSPRQAGYRFRAT